ncbi:MAG: nucleotidyltransferase domain-containing protein [Bacteroidales bacterium]
MRLNHKQQVIIHNTARKHFEEDVAVFLFGSRANPDEKGGDIDLLLDNVPKEKRTVENKVAFLADLKKQLGDQRIDVVFKSWSAPKSVFQKSIDKTKVPL